MYASHTVRSIVFFSVKGGVSGTRFSVERDTKRGQLLKDWGEQPKMKL